MSEFSVRAKSFIAERLNVVAAKYGAVPYFYSAVYQKGDRLVWLEAQPISNTDKSVYQVLLCEADFPRNEVFQTVPVKLPVENEEGIRLMSRAEALQIIQETEQGFAKGGLTLHYEQPYQDRHYSIAAGMKKPAPAPVI